MMKRIFLCVVVVLLAVGQSRAQVEVTKPQFRKSSWGDSMVKVKNMEKKRDLYPEKKDLYVFKSIVAGLDCYVVFNFINDKLTSGKYVTHMDHLNKEQFLFDYQDLVKLLKTKYGAPDDVQELWREGHKKDDYSVMAISLLNGYVTYKTTWNKEKTVIVIKLYSYDNDIRISIQYTSREYNKLNEEKVLEGL